MVYGKYDTTVDRQSAFEDLIKMNEQEQARVQEAQAKAVEKQSKESKKKSGVGGALLASVLGTAITAVSSSIGTEASRAVTGKKVTGKTIADRAIKNTTSAVTRNVTKSLTRSLLGNLMNK